MCCRFQSYLTDDQPLCCRFHGLDALTHGVQHRVRHSAPHVAPFQEAPQGVTGDAEGLGRTASPMPQGVGSHVAADGVVGVLVRQRCLPQGSGISLCHTHSSSSGGMAQGRLCRFGSDCGSHDSAAVPQHSIVRGSDIECKALQGIGFEAILW